MTDYFQNSICDEDEAFALILEAFEHWKIRLGHHPSLDNFQFVFCDEDEEFALILDAVEYRRAQRALRAKRATDWRKKKWQNRLGHPQSCACWNLLFHPNGFPNGNMPLINNKNNIKSLLTLSAAEERVEYICCTFSK